MSDLGIISIPVVMENKGWLYGKTLMEEWFSQTANDEPRKNQPNTDLIKMKWVLSFSRAQSVYREMMTEQVWVNHAAKKQIEKMLKSGNFLTGRPQRFGTPKLGPAFVDSVSIQYRAVNDTLTGLAFSGFDGLTAALGNFVFKVVAIGVVEPILDRDKRLTGRHRVTINEVGVYVKDSYDFNDALGENQYLGNWDYSDDSVGISSFNGGVAVYNSDFREWREETGKGGDFMIFSDIRYTEINPPNVFEF